MFSSHRLSGLRKSSGEFIKEEDQINSHLLEINAKLRKVIENKQNVNATLQPIQALIDRNKLNIGCKLSGPLRNRVIALYNQAKKACEEEEALLRKLLQKINDIHELEYNVNIHRSSISSPPSSSVTASGSNTNKSSKTVQIRRGAFMQYLLHHARNIPVWISPVDIHPPALVGAIPFPDFAAIKIGSEVAAYVNEIWMLSEIVSVNESNGVYEVKDVDDDIQNKSKYLVKRNRLIPLPNWRADPQRDAHALFPTNSVVLALYPQTTCFYKGVVEWIPEKAADDYLVAFEDSSFSQGFSPPLPVPQRFIVAYKLIKSHKCNKPNKHNKTSKRKATAIHHRRDNVDSSDDDEVDE
ncbi:unnamed protein product [Anisakis simplex]|uniref:SGF29 C-terminal domain-containing protein n=1 Tax=Anisakis simplex TaxID=6269 RepID=A0A0M3IYQ3_ANISI|nr:unnamed protein product [Anisakis simplex]